MASIILLDAETKDHNIGITTFGDSVMQAIKDYMSWMKENNLCQEDIEHSGIIEYVDKNDERLLAAIFLEEDGSCELVPPNA